MESVEGIHEIVCKVKESEVHSNGIIDLLELVKEENPPSLVTAALHGLADVFKHYMTLHSGWFISHSSLSLSSSSSDITSSYSVWLRSKYQLTLTTFIKFISISPYQVMVLDELMGLLQCLGKSFETAPTSKGYHFPNDFFLRILSSIISANDLELVSHFVEKYLQFRDIKYFALKNIGSVIGSSLDTAYRNQKSVAPEFVCSVYELLQHVVMKKERDEGKEEEEMEYFVSDPKDWSNQQAKDVQSYEKHCKVFSKSWMLFLQLPLPSCVHKKVLLCLHSHVMPHMNKPHLLVDYLVGSYDQGGVFSILALNGLFILMNHYHIEYPHFYQKLYTLLKPDIFTVPYTGRFFRLLNVFLSSSHLPLYLVAAFTKRIARLSLTAPPEGVMIASVMVMNLIRRHPNCRVLLHRSTTEIFEIDSDPFLMEESDPSLSHALESCLWELKTLQCHYHPAVSSLLTRLLDPEKQGKEESLHPYLQLTRKQLFLNEFSICADGEEEEVEIPLNFTCPTTFWTTQ